MEYEKKLRYNPNCAMCQGRGVYTTSNTSGTQSTTRICDCHIFYDIEENSQDVDDDVVNMVNKEFWNIIGTNMKTGIELIAEERQRQIEVEGWTLKHDKEHEDGELANAGAYYALTEDMLQYIDDNWGNDMHLSIWQFDLKFLKRDRSKNSINNRIRDLQKAGALIAAEIDRLQNLEI